MDAEEMLHLMRERGIPEERIQLMRNCGIDLNAWLQGFTDTSEAVRDTVNLIHNHPLMPEGIRASGYIMDSVTGLLTPIEE